MKESDLQRAIRREIERLGGKAVKVHGSPFTEVGTPDILGVLDGTSFAIEAKLPGNEPTPRQCHELNEWRKQGWASGVAHTVEEALLIIRANALPHEEVA